MLRPIRFTLAIFKDTLVYTTVLMLLLNGVLDFRSILYADYYQFFFNIVKVVYGTLLSFIANMNSEWVDFHIHYVHVIPIFALVLVLFMIGSLIPAYRISRSNTIRMLASEW
jgi:ABC-type antimicrobial peptide transport system permease subunit